MLLALLFSLAADVQDLGGFQAELADLAGPTGAVFAPDGRVLVAESYRDRVVVFDAERHPLAELGRRGVEPGALSDPHGLALAPSGELFVADTGNDRVSVFRLDGTFVRVIGVRGGGPGAFRSPLGVAVDAKKLYVADTGNHRVQVFDHEGHFERSFGAFGGASGELRFPHDLDVAADGRIFVADTDNHRIAVFGAAGQALFTWGVFGPFQGQLASPTCVRVQGERVHVADRDNHRIEVFDRAGKRVHGFGIHALLPHEGAGKLHYPDGLAVAPDGARMLVVEGFEDRAQFFGPITASERALTAGQERNTASHFGGALDAAGVLLAAVEPSAPGIVVYDTTLAEPVEITRWSGYGERVAQFVRPDAIELSPDARHVYVADPGNARLLDYLVDRPAGEPLKYDPALARLSLALDLRKVPELAKDDPDLVPNPIALECAPDGHVFVLDAASQRVVEFTAELKFVGAFSPFASFGPRAASRRPIDLAVDEEGRVLVLDELAGRVHVYDRTPELDGFVYVSGYGAYGDGESELIRPAGIACAPDGRMWISDEARNRVLHFDAKGTFLGALGKPGLARGEFTKPRGLALDPQGRLVVLDWGNHRGQTFAPDGSFVSAFGSRAYLQVMRPKPVAPKKD